MDVIPREWRVPPASVGEGKNVWIWKTSQLMVITLQQSNSVHLVDKMVPHSYCTKSASIKDDFICIVCMLNGKAYRSYSSTFEMEMPSIMRRIRIIQYGSVASYPPHKVHSLRSIMFQHLDKNILLQNNTLLSKSPCSERSLSKNWRWKKRRNKCMNYCYCGPLRDYDRGTRKIRFFSHLMFPTCCFPE